MASAILAKSGFHSLPVRFVDEACADFTPIVIDALQVADGPDGVVVLQHPDSREIVFDGGCDDVRHHHKAAVAAQRHAG